MKHFVTGAAGFIGSNYVRYLLSNTDDEITIYDDLTYAGNLSTIEDMFNTKRVKFIKGNVCSEKMVLEAMKRHDTVVHFAAESHVDRSISGPHVFATTNCVGTSVVMGCALKNEIKRIVHIGTDEVYGSVEVGFSRETDILDPRSPYSSSKAGSDLIALSYNSTYGLPVVVTRCTNNYGPYQYPEKAIPKFITSLMMGDAVPVYGDGMNVRDWIHVSDHCSGIFKVLNDGHAGEIYNIGSGHTVSNMDLVHAILNFMGHGEESILYVADRQGHDKRYALDCTKMHKIGWKPAVEFSDGLRSTIDWYMANKRWWEPLV